MITIGLTGSIGSGKSTVAAIFAELGAHIIDYDVLAREVVAPHREAWEGIVNEFGTEVLKDDLTVDRERLASLVFEDSEKLQRLNRITHPAVFRAAAAMVDEIAAGDSEAIIVKDVPLLIETGIHKTVDKVVVVAASRENRLSRLKARGMSESEALKRIESQMPLTEKIKLADFVIQNDGSRGDTRRQVEEVFKTISHNGGRSAKADFQGG